MDDEKTTSNEINAAINDSYTKLQQGENSIENGEVLDGFEALNGIRSKYGL
jgi:hypothetical protein